VDFHFCDALHAADRVVFLRLMAHEIARKHGGFASFMPKPFGDLAGSGLHYNISLGNGQTPNAFRRPEHEGCDEHGLGLSNLAYHFVGGVLKHLAAITAVVAPTVNSYKRLVVQGSSSGFTWAPVFHTYGGNNRTNSLRVPGYGGKRAELRIADTACNPYLGFAMTVAAGLHGIEEAIDPGLPIQSGDNLYEVWAKGPQALEDRGIKMLPRTLGEALDAFESDPLSQKVFGTRLFKSWLSVKRAEWDDFNLSVTDWERRRYLKQF